MLKTEKPACKRVNEKQSISRAAVISPRKRPRLKIKRKLTILFWSEQPGRAAASRASHALRSDGTRRSNGRAHQRSNSRAIEAQSRPLPRSQRPDAGLGVRAPLASRLRTAAAAPVAFLAPRSPSEMSSATRVSRRVHSADVSPGIEDQRGASNSAGCFWKH